MIIYNITFHIEKDIVPECLNFLCLHRVLPHSEEEEGCSFAVQFRVKNIDTLNYWIEREGQAISRQLIQQFGSKVIGFTTVLEEIEL